MEFYHVLNRGVDKRKIFLDDRDRFRFIHDLFEFNDKNPAGSIYYHFRKSPSDIQNVQKRLQRKLLVYIHCFAMMPNHYHLLISPATENGIPKFMKKLNMGYAKYFNEKYNRTGALFQGKYKSAHIENDKHFLYIPYYIHFNPLDLYEPKWRKRKISDIKKSVNFLGSYRWSSHLDYLGKNNFPSVTQRKWMLKYFNGESEYERLFIKELKNYSVDELGGISLE
ncbi:MAG: transposase [Patescibacteria group bacterium]